MSEPIVIRPERADHPRVAALLAELDRYLASLYAPEDNHILGVDALLAPQVDFLAAWRADELLGCGAARRVPGEAATGGRAYGEVKRMIVAPRSRRQRIAASLLAELHARLRRSGVGLALLETGRDQVEAVRLYERCGYRACGPFAGYADNGKSLFMGRELGA